MDNTLLDLHNFIRYLASLVTEQLPLMAQSIPNVPIPAGHLIRLLQITCKYGICCLFLENAILVLFRGGAFTPYFKPHCGVLKWTPGPTVVYLQLFIFFITVSVGLKYSTNKKIEKETDKYDCAKQPFVVKRSALRLFWANRILSWAWYQPATCSIK